MWNLTRSTHKFIILFSLKNLQYIYNDAMNYVICTPPSYYIHLFCKLDKKAAITKNLLVV